MKRILLLMLLTVICFSCRRVGHGGNQLSVTVSIFPQKYFVEQIGGRFVDVNVMIATGMSHESYSPTPRQLQELGHSKAYIQIGELGFEKIWMPKIIAMNRGMKVYNCSEGIQYRRFAGEKEEIQQSHNPSDYSIFDPHVWMCPRDVKIIATNILKELSELDPAHRREYQQNYKAFIDKVNSVKQLADLKLGGHKGAKFMIFHPALGYLAEDYQLQQISIETEGKEPSARHLQMVIDQARASGIKVIFVQKEFSVSQSETISREIGGKVIQLDPMAYDWDGQMRKVITDLSAALN